MMWIWIGCAIVPLVTIGFLLVRLKQKNETIHALKQAESTCQIQRSAADEERETLRLRLNQANKIEAIGTLAGGIAHDFNNILGGILGFTQLIKLESEGNPYLREYADEILSATNRAKALVEQILAFSRQAKTEKIPVDVGVIAKEALKLLRASIPSTIEFQYDIRSNLGAVLADQTQIHQVIMNLSTNAYQAMAESGGTLSVTLSPSSLIKDTDLSASENRSQPCLKLTVSDTGEGIEERIIHRIFEPYFTTREQGEGTGLGLATVHGIVASHGGEIRVRSKINVGTTFDVYLPLIKKDAIADSLKRDAIVPGDGERVLLVDDEEHIVKLAERILVKLGYSVESFLNPEDALEAFSRKPNEFDLVVTDMTMPKMTGQVLAVKLRDIKENTPILLCTGFSKVMDAQKAADLGINGFLMKPFDIQRMAKAVRQALSA